MFFIIRITLMCFCSLLKKVINFPNDNIKVYYRECVGGGMDCIVLAHDTDGIWAL